MYNIVLGYSLVFGYIIILLFVAAALGKWLFRNQEATRKLVHFFLAFVWLILYHFFVGTIHFVMIPLIFVVVNSLTFQLVRNENQDFLRWLFALKQIERTGELQTPGTVYYALSITIMASMTLWNRAYLIPYGMGVFCMAFGDCMAGVVGKRVKGKLAQKIYGNKTIGGFLSCVIFASIGETIVLAVTGSFNSIDRILFIGIIAGILELPKKGLDNLTVPLGVMMASRWVLSL